ncbi:unnamed protein product [Rotaria socialis]|uniref:Ubiquitin carboxyl-terminal hydrolase n=1 Tax=Rotaria socialis TaxID=392032 RepID=A0A820J910_9BILA|nr:unnamed protein product [Rotaria socialis]CAF4470093.1 unnamed protein product [Rotaria socialis]CAF4756957.1 unnamed protein product [Rotaria socialis]
MSSGSEKGKPVQHSKNDNATPETTQPYGRSISEGYHHSTDNKINRSQLAQYGTTKSSDIGGIKGSTTNPTIQVLSIDRSTKPAQRVSIEILPVDNRRDQKNLLIDLRSTNTSQYGATNSLAMKEDKYRKQNYSSIVEKQLLYTKGVCGLKNIGNSCYMNSALQCLNSIPVFANFFQNYANYEDNGPYLVQAYSNLIKAMWSGDNTCAAAHDVKKELCRYTPTFSDCAQHDAHEFIISLIDALYDELVNRSLSPIVTDHLNINMKSTVKCHTCNVSQTGDESTKFLSLPLPSHTKEPITLSSLLDSFEKAEDLDGEMYCDICHTITKGQQQTTLCAPLPPVIIVQLKRFPFNGTNRKVDTLIDYPYIDFDFERQEHRDDEHLYNLIAISMHSGSLDFGHYTAFAWHNPTHRWYYFNDRNYESIDDVSKFLLKREAYLLIYAKKNVLK